MLRYGGVVDGVPIIGTIGVLDRLHEGEYIYTEDYQDCLKALLENNGGKVRLPEKELLKRLKEGPKP